MFSDRLRFYREERGVSQARIAQIMGVHQSAVSRIEKDTYRPTVAQLLALCKFFKITPDEFLDIRKTK